MLKRLRLLWQALSGRTVLERDMDDELRFHLESRAADLARSGLPPGGSRPPRPHRVRSGGRLQGSLPPGARPAPLGRMARRSALCVSRTAQESVFRADGGRHTGAGHRRQYRDIQRRESGAAESTAVSRSGPAGEAGGIRRWRYARRNAWFCHGLRLAQVEPFFREHVALPQHGGRPGGTGRVGTVGRLAREL